MKIHVSNVGQRLMTELRLLLDHQFAERCGAILQTVFPAIAAPPARSKWDHAGIDLCMFMDDADDFLHVIQCKGFAVAEFGPSQLTQCLHSIDTFARASFKTVRYALIVNRIVKGESRARIEAALQSLVQSGKAETAHLLGLEAFLEMVSVEAQKQLIESLRSSVEKFQKEHRSRMDEGMYVENVPFQVETGRTLHNPLRFVEEQVLKLVEDSKNKRSWTFLSGEFGFGKTSLALHLAEVLQNREIICLYLPAARFHARAFENESQFLWDVLEVIFQEEVDHESDRNKLLHASLREVFKREKRIILIFDGIDEHPICWQEDGLFRVFGIFKIYNTSCLFAVRTEFLAERSGHLQAATKGGPNLFTLRLIEWSEALILEYTKHYQNNHEALDIKNRVGHFEEAVKSGRYIDYYGDIPKRPLFLKMLLDDVAREDLRSRNLAELYTIYIKKKFESDRATSTARPVVRRPLSLQEDYDLVCARLFDVMAMAAGRMIFIEAGEMRLVPSLSEVTLRECVKQIAGASLDLPSILLNSVMVPVGRRNRTQGGHMEVAFAHTSFQEFFVARYMLTEFLQKTVNQTFLTSILPGPVARFLQGLIMTLKSDDQARAVTQFHVMLHT